MRCRSGPSSRRRFRVSSAGSLPRSAPLVGGLVLSLMTLPVIIGEYGPTHGMSMQDCDVMQQRAFALKVPHDGYAAIFGELVYENKPFPLYLSTNVQIVHADDAGDARDDGAGDGKAEHLALRASTSVYATWDDRELGAIRVAPATLVFQDVRDLKLSLDWGESGAPNIMNLQAPTIHEVERVLIAFGQLLGDGRREGGFAVVDVADRAHVDVGLRTLKLLFCHSS